jgi:hypothetical protein
MSKALICGVAFAALVVSGVALSAADFRVPGQPHCDGTPVADYDQDGTAAQESAHKRGSAS